MTKATQVIKERMAKGFQEIEDRRIAVDYIIVHPDNHAALIKEFEYTSLDGKEVTGKDLLVWGARIVVADVHPKGLVQVCSRLIEPSEPHNMNQFTSVVDLSDILS
jgi:hypothetical protein